MGNSQSEKNKEFEEKIAALQEQINDAKEEKRRETLMNMKPNLALGNRLNKLCKHTIRNELTPGPSTNALMLVFHFRTMLQLAITDVNTTYQNNDFPLNGCLFDPDSAREVIKQLIILVEDSITFENAYNEWSENRAETIKCLSVVCERLDEVEKKSQVTNIAGASVGITASALMITGLALTPVTFGGSLALCVVGGVVSVGALGTNIGGTIVKKKENQPFEREIEECLEEDAAKTFKLIKLINKIVEQTELITEAMGVQNISTTIEAMNNPLLKDHCTIPQNIASILSKSATSIGTILNTIDDPVHALTAARVGGMAVGIPLAGIAAAIDLVVLIKNGKDLYTGKGSNLADKIRTEILPKIKTEAVKIHDFRSTMSSNICGDQLSIANVRPPTMALEWRPESQISAD